MWIIIKYYFLLTSILARSRDWPSWNGLATQLVEVATGFEDYSFDIRYLGSVIIIDIRYFVSVIIIDIFILLFIDSIVNWDSWLLSVIWLAVSLHCQVGDFCSIAVCFPSEDFPECLNLPLTSWDLVSDPSKCLMIIMSSQYPIFLTLMRFISTTCYFFLQHVAWVNILLWSFILVEHFWFILLYFLVLVSLFLVLSSLLGLYGSCIEVHLLSCQWPSLVASGH